MTLIIYRDGEKAGRSMGDSAAGTGLGRYSQDTPLVCEPCWLFSGPRCLSWLTMYISLYIPNNNLAKYHCQTSRTEARLFFAFGKEAYCSRSLAGVSGL
jgi:hypothetical protein